MKIGQQGSRFVNGGAAGVAATSILTWMFVKGCDEDQKPGASSSSIHVPVQLGHQRQRWSSHMSIKSSADSGICAGGGSIGIMHQFNPWFNSLVSNITSVSKTSLDASPGHHQLPSMSQDAPTNKKLIAEYDFVVVGHGNAGKCAVVTLQQECPGATIALVDPLRPPVRQKKAGKTSKKIRYYNLPALGFHPPTRTVELPGDSVSGTSTQLIRYRHSILVATGSRGAPPPMELLDRRIWNRVLELRPTDIFGNTHDRPVLPPETIRQLSLIASSQGAKVGVLGSGWEALELVVAASVRSERSSLPMLAFGSAGPLSHLLPRYLSTAVTKRLRQQGIDIHERALVRYVSHHQVLGAAATNKGTGSSRMEVHTAKSFDLLDTQRKLVDLLVVAPYVDGPRGTAVLPMLNVPESVDENTSLGRTWYQSWSQLSSPQAEPSTVVCYADDGRISVNAELSAASKVYAAGSVAKYPNSVTGHAHVSGEGSVDGALAGRLAALHMARDYQERTRSSMLVRKDTMDIAPASFASKSFPIFRSDISPYNSEEGHQSSLSKVGIKALVVGHCDSEKMSTHGFWWTNMADKRHNSTADASSLRQKRTKSSNGSPIYGSGFVFYLDGTGRIRGVMSWGLPITSGTSISVNGTTEELNPRLVNRMIEIIKTNGGIAREGRDQNDPLLNATHLSEESRHLAQVALSAGINNNRRRRLTAKIIRLGKPLHRYTAAKPPNVTSIGLLKRKDQSVFSELLGENIYIKDDDTYDERPPSLLYIYPMHSARAWRSSISSFGGGDEEEEQWQNPYLLSKEDRIDQAWKENERRARPSKEEPLWLRRGDALRNVKMQDVMNDVFLSNMRSGRFADGSEPFQRAKVPKLVQEASAKLRSLVGVGSASEESSTGTGNEEDEDDGDDQHYDDDDDSEDE